MLLLGGRGEQQEAGAGRAGGGGAEARHQHCRQPEGDGGAHEDARGYRVLARRDKVSPHSFCCLVRKKKVQLYISIVTSMNVVQMQYNPRGKVGELEEAEIHMTQATERFDKVLQSDDPSEAQNVPDMYLEPIRLSLSEPDFTREICV